MKEVATLLITTSCLALAGLGIYFFSSNSGDSEPKQKGGKNKRQNTNKKVIDVIPDKSDNDSISEDSISSDNDSYNDNLSEDSEIYNETANKYNSKKNTKSNKTLKNKNKSSTSRKKYYY